MRSGALISAADSLPGPDGRHSEKAQAPRPMTAHAALGSVRAPLRLLPRSAWLALLAVGLAIIALALVGTGAPGTARVSLLVLALLALALVLVIGRLQVARAVRREQRLMAAERDARALEELVESRTRELSSLSTHLQEFAEKEKFELARNLHDELGGLLTAAKMDLSWLQGHMSAPPPALEQHLQQLGNVLDEAMDVKRRVVEDLRPSLLDHFGLPAALRAHVESVCGKSGLACEISVDDDAAVPKDIAIGLFRVVQEGLANIERHAHARSVHLTLAGDADRYRLEIADDGRGIDLQDPEFRWSQGLTGTRHRVRALGGELTLVSAPGTGTTLRVDVPRPAPEPGT